MTIEPSSAAAQLLEWYRAMGVHDLTGEAPRDWFAYAQEHKKPGAKPDLQKQTAPSAPAEQRKRVAPVAPDEAVLDARERAARATSLGELEAELDGFNGCALKATAKHTCFKRGSDTARIMLIGEGPGRDEDLQGKPFVGRAGQLLDKMLAAISLGEEDVYITNIVYWRPPGNRTPTPQEVEACLPFLHRQAELLDPVFVILIGGPASQNLLGAKEGIMRLRGKWRECELGGKKRQALPILHPAYLLRTPAAKRQAWTDLLTLKKALQ